jgi:AcrR family transcriptional regulator
MARRSELKREQLEALIVKTAENLLVKEGISAVSARKIATKIGYTPGSIYIFFSSIDELILRVNANTLEEIHAAIVKAIAAAKGKPATAVENIAHAYMDYAKRNLKRWRAIYELSYSEDHDLPKWYSEVVEAIFASVDEVLYKYTGCHKEARIQSQVLWSSIHGIASLALTQKLSSVKGGSANAILDSFITGFIASLKKN